MITISPNFKNKPPFDPIKAFAPVSLIGLGSTMMVVHPSTPVSSVKELIAYAKSQPPGTLRFGHSGMGSTNHLAGELFGVTGAQRSQAVPDIPTIAETLKGYDVPVWYGFLVTAKTPAAIVNKLHAETQRALRTPEVKDRLAAQGIETRTASSSSGTKTSPVAAMRSGTSRRKAPGTRKPGVAGFSMTL